MPAFKILNDKNDKKLEKLETKSIEDGEKGLRHLIEKNLMEVFGVELIASEFTVRGDLEYGRIDTVGLGENGEPVIIEYKLDRSSSLVDQALCYRNWLNRHHRSDFKNEVRKKKPGEKKDVNWSSLRVICVAKRFGRYAIPAVREMNVNIELWRYQLYGDNILSLEQVNSLFTSHETVDNKTKSEGIHSIEEHLKGIPEKIISLFETIREYLLNLGGHVEEVPRQKYVAYKTSQNFASVQVQKGKIDIYLKIEFSEIQQSEHDIIAQDVTDVGKPCTGNTRLNIESDKDFDRAKQYIEMSFNKFE